MFMTLSQMHLLLYQSYVYTSYPHSGNLPPASASGPRGSVVLAEQAVIIVESAVLLLLILMSEKSVMNEEMKTGV